ncbi:MAG: hypothetical protein ACREL1_06690 [bacterium]
MSPTPTEIHTATPIPTPSPTATRTPVVVSRPVIFPNPVSGDGPVSLWVPGPFVHGKVQLRIFTTAFRMVHQINDFNQTGGKAVALPVKDRSGTALADGLYYVEVESPRSQWIVKLLILK